MYCFIDICNLFSASHELFNKVEKPRPPSMWKTHSGELFLLRLYLVIKVCYSMACKLFLILLGFRSIIVPIFCEFYDISADFKYYCLLVLNEDS